MIRKWEFNEPKNTVVITTNNIIQGDSEILYVFHDEDDGIWQFLDNNNCSEENARVVALKEIVELDNSISLISNLPLGYMAHRLSKNSKGKDLYTIKVVIDEYGNVVTAFPIK